MSRVPTRRGLKRAGVAAASLLLLLSAVWSGFDEGGPTASEGPPGISSPLAGDSVLAAAFRDRISDVVVEGRGRVRRTLPDDTIGSPHQRFILALASGQTLLVSHNVELAPRVEELRPGVPVEFRGEYEWNDRGGVIHWTHHDPTGRRPGGWIRVGGRTYR